MLSYGTIMARPVYKISHHAFWTTNKSTQSQKQMTTAIKINVMLVEVENYSLSQAAEQSMI